MEKETTKKQQNTRDLFMFFLGMTTATAIILITNFITYINS